MFLVFEARHDLVRLRLQIGAQQAPFRRGIEEWQAAACDEIVHQRGDEHRLAGAREPGDAEPNCRRDETRGKIADIADGVAGGVRIGGDRHASDTSFALMTPCHAPHSLPGEPKEEPRNIWHLLIRPHCTTCLLYTSPSPRDRTRSRMPS